MSNVLHDTPPRKLHQTLTMIYPFYYISMVFQAPTGAEPPLEIKNVKPPLDKFLNTPLGKDSIPY